MLDFCYNLSGSSFWDSAFTFMSWFGDGKIVPIALVLSFSLVIFYKKSRATAAVFVLAPLIGEVVKLFLKEVVKRPRPSWVGCEYMPQLSDYSFPSGHVIFYTIVFGLLAFLSRDQRGLFKKVIFWISVSVVPLVGFSRIYLGVHWLTDVLAGYAIGGIILALAIMVLKKWESGDE